MEATHDIITAKGLAHRKSHIWTLNNNTLCHRIKSYKLNGRNNLCTTWFCFTKATFADPKIVFGEHLSNQVDYRFVGKLDVCSAKSQNIKKTVPLTFLLPRCWMLLTFRRWFDSEKSGKGGYRKHSLIGHNPRKSNCPVRL